MRRNYELAIQRALISWVKQYPLVKCVANLNEHARHMNGIGVDVGSPDLKLYTRRGDVTYFLFLELKRTKGRLSEPQILWEETFDRHYKSSNCIHSVAYGFDEAKKEITAWINSLPAACTE